MFDDLIPELPDAPPYPVAGVAVPTLITFRPLERAERALMAAALRQEATDPPPAFDREQADEASLVAMSRYQARQLVAQVVRLEIGGVDRTAEAAAFLDAYAQRRPLGFAALVAYAHRPASYGVTTEAPIDAEAIAGNS